MSVFFSIIIPIFNSEKHLHQCIDTVLAQSFKEFELLLIDDGSSDASVSICEEYSHMDFRVKVFKKENGGASTARNYGLRNATGEWILFIDSDDFVGPDLLSAYVGAIGNVPSSTLVMCNMACSQEGKLPVSYYEQNCFPSFPEFYGAPVWGSSCNKLFNRQVLLANGIVFDEQIRFSEDCLFVAEYCSHVSDIFMLDYIGYYYRILSNYSSKYLDEHTFPKELFLWEKIRQVNKTCSNQLVDGVVMVLLSTAFSGHYFSMVNSCRRVIGKDIMFVKGKRKVPMKWLFLTNSRVWWMVIFAIYGSLFRVGLI